MYQDDAISKKLAEKVRIAKTEANDRFNPHTDSDETWVREIRKAFQVFQIAKYEKKYRRTSERLADEWGIKDKNLVDRAWYIIDHGDDQIKEDVRRGFLGINAAYNKVRGFEAGHLFHNIKFEDIIVRIPLKVAEEIDTTSLRWIILGTGDPPTTLPEGGKIYHRG